MKTPVITRTSDVLTDSYGITTIEADGDLFIGAIHINQEENSRIKPHNYHRALPLTRYITPKVHYGIAIGIGLFVTISVVGVIIFSFVELGLGNNLVGAVRLRGI